MCVCAIILCLAIGAILLAPPAEGNPKDALTAWVYQQKARLLQGIAKHNLREDEAQRALDQALRALSLAEHLKDGDAMRVSREAITIARTALARIRAAERRDRFRLLALDKLSEFQSHARELRLASPSGVRAPDANKGEVAVVSMIRGTMEIQTSSGWAPYRGDFPIMAGDVVRTGPGGFAEIIFPGGAIVNLDANSRFEAARLDEEEFVYDRILGRMRASYHCVKTGEASCPPQRFRTDKLNVAVRGTEFELEARADGGVSVAVIRNAVEITPLKGGNAVQIHAGQKAVFTKDNKVERWLTFDPGKLHRWWE